MSDAPPQPVPVPAPAPTQEQAPQQELPKVDPSSVIVTPKNEEVSVGDMYNAYEELKKIQAERQAAPPQTQVDQEKMQQFETWQKAMSGDQEAVKEVWNQYAPKEETVEEETPDAARLKQLEEKYDALTNAITQSKQVTDGISTMWAWNNLNNFIQKNKQNCPLTASAPLGNKLFSAKLNELNQLWYAHTGGKQTLDQLPAAQQEQAALEALKQVEGELGSAAKGWGFSPPTVGGVEAVDDQAPAKTTQEQLDDTYRRARMTVDSEGNLIDRVTGKRILGPQGTNLPPQNLPTQPVTNAPTGHGVGASGMEETPPGPLTMKSMRQKMRDRLESV